MPIPAEVAGVLLQLGVAGAFIWYLWNQVKELRQSHQAEVARLCEEHRDEVAELKARCMKLDEELKATYLKRIEDGVTTETILWQINNALQPIAEMASRQAGRRAGSQRELPPDDAPVGG